MASWWENLDISTTPAGNQSANNEAQPQTVCLEGGLAALLESGEEEDNFAEICD
jgi:hypothetical protein